MPRITVLPLDVTFDASDGQTIMDAAHEAGLFWPTTCGGDGICTTCMCSVEKGERNLEPLGRSELKTLAAERPESSIREQSLRLACQARVHGNVSVRKIGVRRDGE